MSRPVNIAAIVKQAAEDAEGGPPPVPGVSSAMDGKQNKSTGAAGGQDIRVRLDTLLSRSNPHRYGRKVTPRQ